MPSARLTLKSNKQPESRENQHHQVKLPDLKVQVVSITFSKYILDAFECCMLNNKLEKCICNSFKKKKNRTIGVKFISLFHIMMLFFLGNNSPIYRVFWLKFLPPSKKIPFFSFDTIAISKITK